MNKNNEYINFPIEELRNMMKSYKKKILFGYLSYDEAKSQAEPVLDAINWHMMDLCWELNRKIKTYSFHEIIKRLPID